MDRKSVPAENLPSNIFKVLNENSEWARPNYRQFFLQKHLEDSRTHKAEAEFVVKSASKNIYEIVFDVLKHFELNPQLPPIDIDANTLYSRLSNFFNPVSLMTPALALRSVASNLPADVEERAIALANLHREYRQELIPLLEPVLRSRLKVANDLTLEDKRNLAKSINEEVSNYGLAIRCKKSEPLSGDTSIDVPGIMVADSPRSTDRVGRFRIEFRDEDGKAHRTTLPSDLDEFSLMISPTLQSSEPGSNKSSNFTERVSKGKTRRR